jgi:hypothetical protein
MQNEGNEEAPPVASGEQLAPEQHELLEASDADWETASGENEDEAAGASEHDGDPSESANDDADSSSSGDSQAARGRGQHGCEHYRRRCRRWCSCLCSIGQLK